MTRREVEIDAETWHRLAALAGPDRSVAELLELWVRSIDPETKEMRGRLGRCPECHALSSVRECWRCGVPIPDLPAENPG